MDPAFIYAPVIVSELLSIFIPNKPRLVRTLYWKYRVTASIPLPGASKYEVYQCAKHYEQLTQVRLGCSTNILTITKRFEMLAYSTMTHMKSSEANRLLKKVLDYGKTVNGTFSSLSEGGRDLLPLPIELEELPVIGVTNMKMNAALDSISPDPSRAVTDVDF